LVPLAPRLEWTTIDDDLPVAGFDFDFKYTDRQAPVVVACMAAATTRARQLGLTWHWRTLGDGHLRVIVNGNSRRTDLLGYRLERDLPLVAEGCRAADLPPSRRRDVGRGVADLFLRGRHVRQEDTMVLRGATETRYYYPPYEYECPQYPLLHARLGTTVNVIVAWNFREIAPEILLEELHTACELVLEESVNRRSKRLSFQQLIEAAEAAGHLKTHPFAEAPDPVRLLTELKDLRKDVRHRAKAGAQGWLDDNWEAVALIVEHLVDQLNRHGPTPTASAKG